MHHYSKERRTGPMPPQPSGSFRQSPARSILQQETWGASGNIEATVASVLSPAELKKVKALVNTPEIQDAVQRDIALGNQRGVSQTASMFVMQMARSFPCLLGRLPIPC